MTDVRNLRRDQIRRRSADVGRGAPDDRVRWSRADPTATVSVAHGPVALGHRRLSIIDLTARGAQPMVDSASD